MKTIIRITGQIGGNHKLLSALNSYRCTHKNGMFYSHLLEFETKKEAIKAIRECFWYMKNNDLEVRANKDRTAIYYDASKAEVILKRDYLG